VKRRRRIKTKNSNAVNCNLKQFLFRNKVSQTFVSGTLLDLKKSILFESLIGF